MAGTITVDTIQSDSSYTSSINIASPVNFAQSFTVGGQSSSFGSRNKIINGAMQVAQRNNYTTSTTVTVTSSDGTGFYDVDRFSTNIRNASVITQQSTDAPTGQGFSYSKKLTVNSASSNTTHNYCEVAYNMEGYDVHTLGWDYTNPNSYITVSFWAKSSVAGTYVFQLRNPGEKIFSKYYTLAANTWTKVTVSIPGNSEWTYGSSILNTNGYELIFMWNMDTGTYYTDSSSPIESWFATDGFNYYKDYPQRWLSNAGATFNLTGVQVEAGKVATPFEFKPYRDDLRDCQRYYQTFFGYQGIMATYAELSGVICLPVSMRAQASLAYTKIGGLASGLTGFQMRNDSALKSSYNYIQWWVPDANTSDSYIEFLGTATTEPY